MARICCVVSDLIFATKIRGTAQMLGADAQVVRSAAELFATLGDTDPLVIVDLDLSDEDPLVLIENLRSRRPACRILAFVSHLRTELAAAAEHCGADTVLPRSRFSAQLPQILGSAQTP